MIKLTAGKFFWILLLLTVAGEFLVPFILKSHYPGYNSNTTVMSVLGSPQSPVGMIYNSWLLWLGCFLIVTSFVYFDQVKNTSLSLAVLILISIIVFAVGAGILSGIFSVNETKDLNTLSSKIHGFGAAIGFMTLLFFPLLMGIVSFKQKSYIYGGLLLITFLLALIFFILFIMADKEQFKNTFVSYEGLWERLTLMTMYLPFVYQAVIKIFS